jgi:hypothetical protein
MTVPIKIVVRQMTVVQGKAAIKAVEAVADTVATVIPTRALLRALVAHRVKVARLEMRTVDRTSHNASVTKAICKFSLTHFFNEY